MRIVKTAVFALLLAAAVPAAADEEQEKEQKGRVAEAVEVEREMFPFFPSLLTTPDGKPVPSSAFEDPSICRGCHPALYKQWDGSMHSLAFVDPVFQALWRIGVEETGGMVENLCAGCHTAISTIAGEVELGEDGKFRASPIGEKGVQCDLCHTIRSSRRAVTPTFEPQNASILIEPGDVKLGPYDDSDSPYHDTEYSELHTRSEFCANCHNVFHPSNNFPIENTYYEWKTSVYAQAGIQCQDCHMMPVAKAVEAARTLTRPKNPGQPCISGPMREQMYTHEFVGGNFAVTALLGKQDHAALAIERLKHAASLELLLPERAEPGRMVQFKVRVRNETAGHNLPTSLTEVRQVWIEVVAKAGEREVFRSGALDEAGSVDPEATMFHAKAVDKDGHHTVKPWEIVRFEYNKTIPPKGSATAPYAFELPEDATGPLTVTATLHYRSYDQALADLLLGKDALKVPMIDMTSASGQIALP